MPSEFQSSATSNNMSYTQKTKPRSGNKYTSTRLMKFRCVPGSRVRSVVAAKTMEVGALGPAVSSYTRVVPHGSPCTPEYTRVVPQGSPCTPEYTRVAPLLVELQHRSHVLKVATSPPLRVREWPLREKYDKGWKSTCKHTSLKYGRQHQTIKR